MSPPIYTPDGSEVSEIVLPDGSTASEVIGPDGNVVFEAGPDIPDSGNLQARYDARELSQSDGQTVSTWPDETGNGHDLSANGSPTFVSSSPVGLPAVDMTTSDSFDVSFGSAVAEPWSVFFLGRFTTADDFVIMWADNPDPSTGLRGLGPDGGGNYSWLQNGQNDPTIGGNTDTNTHIHGSVVTTGSGSLRIDGTLVGDPDPSPSGNPADLDGFFLGASSGGNSSAIEVTEVLVYSADESANQTEIESYLDRNTSLL